MANELTISASLKFEKNGALVDGAFGGIQVTVSGDNAMKNVQNVGTSEEALLLGDVVAGGYWLFKNLDATNYVEIRQGTGIADLVRLNAGDIALFRFASDATAPFVIANTAACLLLCIGVDA